MKKIFAPFLFLGLFLISNNLFAQSDYTERVLATDWRNSFVSGATDNGNIFAGGNFDWCSGPLLVAFDSTGSVIWERGSFNDSLGYGWVSDVAFNKANNKIYVCGFLQLGDDIAAYQSIFLCSINPTNGKIEDNALLPAYYFDPKIIVNKSGYVGLQFSDNQTNLYNDTLKFETQINHQLVSVQKDSTFITNDSSYFYEYKNSGDSIGKFPFLNIGLLQSINNNKYAGIYHSRLIILDSAFNVIKQSDSLLYKPHHLVCNDANYYLLNDSPSIKLQHFNSNLESDTTYSYNGFYTGNKRLVNKSLWYKNKILLIGTEVNEFMGGSFFGNQEFGFVKTISPNSNNMKPLVSDATLASVTIHQDSISYGVSSSVILYFTADINVKNNGSDTLNEVELCAYFHQGVNCGISFFDSSFANLHLPPGNSFNYTDHYRIYLTIPPPPYPFGEYKSNICYWTAAPNNLLDADVSNNRACQLVTSVKDIKEVKAISLYPNPASDKVFIQLNDEKIISVQVRDISGRLVSEPVLEYNHFIGVGNLAKGLYFVEMKTDKGFYTEKVAVQ